jgi:branched-chain amino acid transport system ATP-binding protein
VKGVSVLLVEQNIPLALRVADRGYALQVGRVVLEGDIDEFKSTETVRKAYLGGRYFTGMIRSRNGVRKCG